MNDNKGIDFLSKIYRDLHLTEAAIHTKENNDKKREIIRKYIDRLDKL